MEKDDNVTITCTGDENFYACFFPREEYISKRGGGGSGIFGFPFGTDEPQFTEKVTIPSDDDYYLVLRVGVFSGSARVSVKVTHLRRAKGR